MAASMMFVRECVYGLETHRTPNTTTLTRHRDSWREGMKMGKDYDTSNAMVGETDQV